MTPLVVLADVDRWDSDVPAVLTRALRSPGVRLAATAAARAAVPAALPATFARSVTVPPLRNRTADLSWLTTAVLADLAPGREVRLTPDAQRTLARHGWPGNVRELRDALAAALRRRPVGPVEVGDLPESCQSSPRGTLRPVDQAERDTIVGALRGSGGNRVAAAAVLGLARSTLYRKIAHYGITD
jgi:transcriptional regulator of acetoin/glycerol metabolism